VASFNKIRLSIWNWHFSRELSKVQRKRQLFNLDNADEIGILFDASEKSGYDLVYRYIKDLQDKNKKVKALGFVNDIKIPHYCHPRLSFDYLTLNDLNWYYKPNNKFVTDFLKIDFDMCINFDKSDNMHLKYVAGLSKAKFKVGVYKESNEKYYDLMIKVKDSARLKDYINEVDHYISLLKSPEKKS